MTAVDEICQLDEAIVSAYARFENGADPGKCLEWLWEEYTHIMKGEAVYPMEEDCISEHASRTNYDLYTDSDGTVRGTCWTNDNRDEGYASEFAEWPVTYRTVDEALRATGRTHRGWSGSHITVWLNGERV